MKIFNILFFISIAVTLSVITFYALKKKKLYKDKLRQPFPDHWTEILEQRVFFFKELSEEDKQLFKKRIQRFLASKRIEGIDVEMDDAIRLMVAASAVIPTFAFREYNYPRVNVILIYPNSFDEQFQTQRFEGHKEFISGMVSNRFMNGTVILSKPDLVKAFDGLPHTGNVGIHEFVHLLDKEDGDIDGIPELLLQHRYVGPWLHEIKSEMMRITEGKSDINPYALTNNAEFLAVVSEYFFSNPKTFRARHTELYEFLSKIYDTNIKI